MKKILALLGALLAVISTLSVGTWAYFSDTEQTDTNVITAGILDLTLDAASGATTAFLTTGVTNAEPGDTGSDSTLLKNTAGTISGELDINLGNVSQTAGAIGEFAGGTELGANLYVAIWLDKDNSGSWNADDVGLKNATDTEYTYVAGVSSTTTGAGTTTTIVDTALNQADDYWNGFLVSVTSGTYSGLKAVVTDFDAASDTLTITALPAALGVGITYTLSGPLYYTIASFDDLGKFDNVLTMAVDSSPGDDWDFTIEWMIPATVGNTIQGDAAQFDAISFVLEQAAAD